MPRDMGTSSSKGNNGGERGREEDNDEGGREEIDKEHIGRSKKGYKVWVENRGAVAIEILSQSKSQNNSDLWKLAISLGPTQSNILYVHEPRSNLPSKEAIVFQGTKGGPGMCITRSNQGTWVKEGNNYKDKGSSQLRKEA